jgi:hypothetical protein
MSTAAKTAQPAQISQYKYRSIHCRARFSTQLSKTESCLYRNAPVDGVVSGNSSNKRRQPSASGIRTHMTTTTDFNRAALQPRPKTKMTNSSTRRGFQPRKTESPGLHRANARIPQNAQRNYEHYLALAHAETLTGDRISAENYFQHAEHYLRSMAENPN